jgi:endonuclease/exonuclease/phosphatase (EEP) superfamily protein YafD
MLALAGLALTAVLGLGGGQSRTLDILNHLTPIYLLASLALIAIAVLAKPVRWPWAAVGGAGALAALCLIAPEMAARFSEPKPAPGQGLTVSVMTQNVWDHNVSPATTAAAIIKAGPDVVVLQEGWGAGHDIIGLLAAAYPYRADCTTLSEWCSMAILSKRPILSWSHREGAWKPPEWDRLGLVRATIDGGPAGPFEIVGTQLLHPDPSGKAAAQAGQLLTLMDGVDPRRTILVGDFNLTPWSFALRRFDARMPLRRRSHAVATWPHRLPMLGGGWFPAPFMPIDQIYAGSAWTVQSVRRGPGTGSDHFGLVARMVYQP